MMMTAVAPELVRPDRRYTISDVGVGVHAPHEILRVLDLTLMRVPTRSVDCSIVLSVTKDADRWRICDEYGVITSLPAFAAAPEVSGALTSVMVERVGRMTDEVIVSGTIVAKDDFALALVGESWESCILIATHLSLRGWSIVTPRYAFVDPETRGVEPFSKLLHIPTRIIPQLPLQYRRALEASPWYVAGTDIGFYAVDQLRVPGTPSPSERPTLRACLIVDPSRHEPNGAVYQPAHADVGSFLPFTDVGIAAASVVAGEAVPTTDAVVRWLSSLPGIG
jgi:hypothetical protein